MNSAKIIDFLLKRKKYIYFTGWFCFFNFILTLLLGLRYAKFIFPLEGFISYLYFPLAMIGHFGSLAIFIFLFLFIPIAFIFPRRLFIWPVCVLIASIFIIILMIDYEVYCQYRFHLNGVVFELMMGAGTEIFDISWSTYLYGIFSIVFVLAVEFFIVWLVWNKILTEKRRKTGVLFFITAFLIIFISHSIHAWADFVYFRPVTSMTRHLPLYKPLTAKTFIEEHKLFKVGDNFKRRKFRIRNPLYRCWRYR